MRKSPGGVLSSPYQTTRGLLEIPPYFEVQREFRGQFPSSGSVGSHKPLAQTPVKFGPVRVESRRLRGLRDKGGLELELGEIGTIAAVLITNNLVEFLRLGRLSACSFDEGGQGLRHGC